MRQRSILLPQLRWYLDSSAKLLLTFLELWLKLLVFLDQFLEFGLRFYQGGLEVFVLALEGRYLLVFVNEVVQLKLQIQLLWA